MKWSYVCTDIYKAKRKNTSNSPKGRTRDTSLASARIAECRTIPKLLQVIQITICPSTSPGTFPNTVLLNEWMNELIDEWIDGWGFRPHLCIYRHGLNWSLWGAFDSKAYIKSFSCSMDGTTPTRHVAWSESHVDWDVFPNNMDMTSYLTSFSGFPYVAWYSDAAKIATWNDRNSSILSVFRRPHPCTCEPSLIII